MQITSNNQGRVKAWYPGDSTNKWKPPRPSQWHWSPKTAACIVHDPLFVLQLMPPWPWLSQSTCKSPASYRTPVGEYLLKWNHRETTEKPQRNHQNHLFWLHAIFMYLLKHINAMNSWSIRKSFILKWILEHPGWASKIFEPVLRDKISLPWPVYAEGKPSPSPTWQWKIRHLQPFTEDSQSSTSICRWDFPIFPHFLYFPIFPSFTTSIFPIFSQIFQWFPKAGMGSWGPHCGELRRGPPQSQRPQESLKEIWKTVCS